MSNDKALVKVDTAIVSTNVEDCPFCIDGKFGNEKCPLCEGTGLVEFCSEDEFMDGGWE